MNDFFCSLPWTGIDIGPQGGFKPCCKYSQTISHDLENYLDSPHLHSLRKQFQNGEKPIGCKRCWDDESAGLASKRQLDRQYTFGNQNPDLTSWKIMSFSFGNTCNLACVTCNSSSSSRWVRDEKKLHANNRFKEKVIHSHKKFYRDQRFMQDLSQRCDDLLHIDIPGGEPFFADKQIHKEFLDSLKNPDKIKIHYTTNGTIFPDDDFWKIWKKFKKIDIQLSIDSTEAKFEYLRYPADWKVLIQHIAQYQERRDDIQISISHTVSWINLMDLDSFIVWCRDHDLPDPYIGMVSNPRYLNIKSLPGVVKKQIRDQAENRHPETKKVLDYMDSENLEIDFSKGVDWVRSLDLIRNTDFSRTFPEITEILRTHGFW